MQKDQIPPLPNLEVRVLQQCQGRSLCTEAIRDLQLLLLGFLCRAHFTLLATEVLREELRYLREVLESIGLPVLLLLPQVMEKHSATQLPKGSRLHWRACFSGGDEAPGILQ